eukprot:TRINITY_DN11126_c0_g1_i1.p1 TRINITY_DN11126_c0_g1~~TRINITY_DN11126_c0_g1_i1.p1  ORF type:complete len:397 (-),score=99.19 TRINITY_DN11126_c0_g1_i1:5-1195(-)
MSGEDRKHDYEKKSVSGRCEACKKKFSVLGKGYRCKKCKLSCHTKCADKVKSKCVNTCAFALQPSSSPARAPAQTEAEKEELRLKEREAAEEAEDLRLRKEDIEQSKREARQTTDKDIDNFLDELGIDEGDLKVKERDIEVDDTPLASSTVSAKQKKVAPHIGRLKGSPGLASFSSSAGRAVTDGGDVVSEDGVTFELVTKPLDAELVNICLNVHDLNEIQLVKLTGKLSSELYRWTLPEGKETQAHLVTGTYNADTSLTIRGSFIPPSVEENVFAEGTIAAGSDEDLFDLNVKQDKDAYYIQCVPSKWEEKYVVTLKGPKIDFVLTNTEGRWFNRFVELPNLKENQLYHVKDGNCNIRLQPIEGGTFVVQVKKSKLCRARIIAAEGTKEGESSSE